MTSPNERAKERTRSRPQAATPEFIQAELAHCKASRSYFINTYCKIYDNETKSWIPFTLWEAQEEALELTVHNQYVMALKARQLGFTWMWALALSLWKMIFLPISEILLFSQGEVEALELLSEQRMRGMYKHLPEWMQMDAGSADSKSEFRLSNGSGARALPPTRGGDSRTVTDLVIDEADLIPNFSELLARAEPTVGRSGNIVIIGRAAKNSPNSPFKKMYKAAKAGEGKYKCLFIPWFAHPERDKAWYEAQKLDIFSRDGSLDALHEQYPATDTEALQARSLDKRFAGEILSAVTHEAKPIYSAEAPLITGLRLYRLPISGHSYCIGADPSGGTTDGDPAVACVVDSMTYEQVAVLECKAEADIFAEYVADLSVFFNGAMVLFELNNHGLAMLANLRARGVPLKHGISRRGETSKPGWLTTNPSKHLLYDTTAHVFQDCIAESVQSGEPVLPVVCDIKTAFELAGIDVNTLSAPEGDRDDHAMAYVLAQQCAYRGSNSVVAVRHDLWKEKGQPQQNEKVTSPRGIVRSEGSMARGHFGAPPEMPDEARRRLRERGLL